MRSFFTLLAVISAAVAAPVEPREVNAIIPGQWVIKLRDGASDSLLATTIDHAVGLLGVHPTHTYSMGGFKGFSINAGHALVQMLTSITAIDHIEPDFKVHAIGLVKQTNPPCGLARISHRTPGANEYLFDNSAGSGTWSYIIDTGINIQHVDFGGRATFGANFAGDGLNADGNGHGTHVAGTTGSNTYGVAKKTNLIAVKVLDSSGSGSNSMVLAGLDWAVKDAKAKGRIGKSVANLSLGGAFSQITNDAARAAVEQGLFLAVAAGNSGAPTFTSSPASEPVVCTVGASDRFDREASFSNYGELVDIFAPGVDILSTWIGSSTATNTISGTSMASPHIAGLGAYFLGLGAPGGEDLCQIIKDVSTKNAVRNARPSTTTNLAYNGNGR